jgi:hypothetical protein
VVTSDRLLFWSREQQYLSDDLVVDAVCIDLHALSNDPILSVYIQVHDGEKTIELTVVPMAEEGQDQESKCQAIFDALSTLVSQHPIDPNDTYEGFSAGNDDDDEMVCALNNNQNGDQEASAEQRQAMLEHLDDILVVPPEFEQPTGQFDDAEEEEEDDDAVDG